jgi:hypothetical protein
MDFHHDGQGPDNKEKHDGKTGREAIVQTGKR